MEEEEEARVPVGCSSPARARQRKDGTAERKDGRILDSFSRRQIGRRIMESSRVRWLPWRRTGWVGPRGRGDSGEAEEEALRRRRRRRKGG
jgi:hypothetical protein